MAKNEKNTDWLTDSLTVAEVSAPEKPVTKEKPPTSTPRTRKPRKEKAVLNAVESASSFRGKLQKTVEGNKEVQALEAEINRIGLATLNRMCTVNNDKEGLAMLNLGKWRIVARIGTTGTLKVLRIKPTQLWGTTAPPWQLDSGCSGT